MSSTISTQDSVRHSPALLYPTLLIAGIAVIIASMLGIAVMTGLLPPAQLQSVAGRNDGRTADAKTRPAKAGGTEAVGAKTAGSKTAAPAAARCMDCGVVDSVRAVEARGEGPGVGAVAGAHAGHEPGKNMKKNVSYEIRVRMDDHSYRTFHAARPDVGVGQRVKIRDGRPVSAG